MKMAELGNIGKYIEERRIYTPFTAPEVSVGNILYLTGVCTMILPVYDENMEISEERLIAIIKCDEELPCYKKNCTVAVEVAMKESYLAALKRRLYLCLFNQRVTMMAHMTDKRIVKDEIVCKIETGTMFSVNKKEDVKKNV